MGLFLLYLSIALFFSFLCSLLKATLLSVTPFTVKTLKVLIYSPLYPIIVFCQFITRRLKKDKERSVLSRADFTAMAEIGMKAGISRDEESKILTNLLRLNKLQARDIMTPRMVVAAAPEAMTAEEFYRQFGDQSFSRIPVFRDTIDQVQGYVLKGEVLSELEKATSRSLFGISAGLSWGCPPSCPFPICSTS